MSKSISILALSMLFLTQLIFGQITPNEIVYRMGRGINIGNTFDAPNEGAWSLPLKEEHIKDIKDAGFTNVRIPIRWDEHTDKSAPYQIDPDFLDRIEEVIDWSLNAELVVIINAHHEDWFTKDSQNSLNKDRIISIWSEVSFRFKDKSELLVFELINEPYFEMSKKEMDDFNSYMIPVVRKHNPTRILMITGGGDNSYKTPEQIDLDFFKNDAYLMTTFHYYAPFKFTNYGVKENQKFTWGTPSEKNDAKQNFDQVYDWATKNNIAIYFGEFTANNTCDEESRIEYHRYLTELAVNRGFAFGVWCTTKKTANKYTYDKGTRTWVEEVKEALLTAGSWPAVGINDKASTKPSNVKFEVYPNPIGAQLNIKLGNTYDMVHINICNLLGHQVYNDDHKNTNEISAPINIPKGVYFITITADSQTVSQKIIKS